MGTEKNKTSMMEVRQTMDLQYWIIGHKMNGAIIYRAESKEDAERTLRLWTLAEDMAEVIDLVEHTLLVNGKTNWLAYTDAKTMIKRITER